MRSWLFFAMTVLVASCSSQPADVHVSGDGGSSTSPTSGDVMRQRLVEAADEYGELGEASRIALFDIAFPANDHELRETSGNAVLLLTTLSQLPDELPPSRLYVSVDGVEHPLRLISPIKIEQPVPAAVAEVLGDERWDGLYQLPLALVRDDAALLVDFATRRRGFVLGRFADDQYATLGYTVPREDLVPTGDQPMSALVTLVAREFPGLLESPP